MQQAQTHSDALLSRRQFHRGVAAAVAGGLALGQLPAASLAQGTRPPGAHVHRDGPLHQRSR